MKNKNLILINDFSNKLLTIILPYALFILPSIEKIGRLNSIYILTVFFFMILKIKKDNIKKLHIPIIMIYLFIIYMLFSLIYSLNILGGIIYFISLILGFIMMIYLGIGINEKYINILIKNIHICNNIIIFISFYEMFFGNGLFINNPDFIGRFNNYGLYYPLAFFTNVNDLSYYLIIFIPISFYYYSNSKFKYIKSFLVAILTYFIIINTGSRLSLIYFTIIIIIRQILELKYKKRIIFFILISLFITIFSIIYYQKILELDFFIIRLDLLKGAFESFLQKPLFGLGIGSVYTMLPNTPHSTIATFLADLGLIGIIVFLSFYFYIVIKLIKYLDYNIKGDKKILYLYTTTLMIIFPILTIIPSSAEQEKSTWILVGISLLLIRLSNLKQNI